MASTTTKKRSRKGLALGLAILGVAGLSLASAAQLTVNSTKLASGVTIVGSCDADNAVDISYKTTFVAASAGSYYKVTDVVLKNLDTNCIGKTVQVDLYNNAATPVLQGGVPATLLTATNLTGTGAAGTATLTLPTTASVPSAPDVKADTVYGAGVVITG